MNKKIKKIIALAILGLQVFVLTPNGWAEDRPMENKKLLVTAYYSPLPNQSFYIRGSYEADIRLNGRGTNGADGTEVYTGMLAAPKTYPFGTRVKIPGLGVGEVHDRGGAILAYKDYDRIDIWMGHGEEGLARALNWGARLVEGEVYYTPRQVEPGLSFSWVSSTLPNSVLDRLRARTQSSPVVASQPTTTVKQSASEKVVQEVKAEVDPEILREITRIEHNWELLEAGLGTDDTGEDVINLQRMLWELGYYDGELSGKYDPMTIDAVLAFQLENGVVDSEWQAGAGYFGKQTHSAMKSIVSNKMDILSGYPKEVQVWVPAKRILPEIASLVVSEYSEERQELLFASEIMNKKIVQEGSLSAEADLNDKGDHVIALQNVLIAYGYLEGGLNTGYYGQQTANAVLKFQIEKGIVSSAQDPGAGRVGPKTLSVLNSI